MSWQPFSKPCALIVVFTLTMAGAHRVSPSEAMKWAFNQVKGATEQVDSLSVFASSEFDPISQEQLKSLEEQMNADPNLQKQVEAAMLDPTLQDQAKLVQECPSCMQMEALHGQEHTDATHGASPSLVELSLSAHPWKKVAALLLIMNTTSAFSFGSQYTARGVARSHGRPATSQAIHGNMPHSVGARRLAGGLSMMADEVSPLDDGPTMGGAAWNGEITTAGPGETENTKFVCDETVDFWRDFQRNPNAPPSLQENARAIADIVAKYTVPGGPHYSLASAAYWAKHLGRTGYFVANALAGTLAFQYFGTSRDGSPSANPMDLDDGQPRGGIGGMGIDGASASRMVLEAISVYEQDWKRIVSGQFKEPWDMELGHRQTSLPFALRQSALFVPEAIEALSRRDRDSPEDRKIWLDDASDMYPDYYKTNYHFQTDGWMSKRSADVYETSTETLFLGKQDAMQRLSLVPLQSLKGRDGKPPRVLEVASGTGRFATFLRDNHPSAQLTQVDLSPFYLEKARENDEYWRKYRAKELEDDGLPAPPPSKFVQAKAEALPFEDGAFDAVVCVYLFHEMPKEARAAAAAEMARVLAPGGTIVLTDSVQRGDRPALDKQLVNFERLNEPHYRNYIDTDIGKLFESQRGIVSSEKLVASTSKTLSFKRPTDFDPRLASTELSSD